VAGASGITNIPIGFSFRQNGIGYVSGQTAITIRYVLVNGTVLQYMGPTTNVVNTNVAVSNAPHP